MEKVTDCLDYLLSTDEEYGEARGRVKGLEHTLKVVKAQAFLEAKGEGTNQEREAIALTSEDYRKTKEVYENAVTEMETIGAKRKTKELIIEVWRSQNANKRQGNI